MIVIDLERQIGRIVFNVVRHLVFQQQRAPQLVGHEERRGVIGFGLDVGDVGGWRVSVAGERRDWV